MEILPLVPAPVVVLPEVVLPDEGVVGVVTEVGVGEAAAAEEAPLREQVGAANASGRAVRREKAVENFMFVAGANT
jgi:hypothetical protein